MKKFFEKHDLFKIASIFVIISVILTWIFKYSYYSQGELVTDSINRVGIFDLSTYSLLGLYYFTVAIVFIFVVAGFYKVISTIPAYQIITSKIAKKFEGKEKILVAVSILIYAILASISSDYMVLLAIIPFSIAIMSKLKLDKVTALSATFGGTLVGILGATYSSKIVGYLVDSSVGVGVKYGYEILGIIIIFVIAYLLLTYFTFLRMGKKIDDPVVDLFASDDNSVSVKAVKADEPVKVEVKEEKHEDKKSYVKNHKSNNKKKVTKANLAKDNGEVKSVKVKKVNVIPMIIILAITAIIIILAFIDWENAFGVSVFTDIYTSITEATVFDVPIFSYILGSYFKAFGSWDLFGASTMLILCLLVIKIIYHVSLDTIIDKVCEGFKSINKTVLLVLTLYVVLEINVIYPTIPALVGKIVGLGGNFATWFFSSLICNIFTVDFQYTMNLVGSLFAKASNTSIAALALQTSYGLVSFVAPTSVMLMIGLSMLNIKYSKWFKFIWKFALAILVVLMIVLAILTYV